ncbi:MAG: transposase [Synergistaceae bacterium]|nr:transposase [Synergistaceae bacterium]
MKKELLKCPVEQIDETTWRVVVWPKDDNGEPEKKNGFLGWVWVRIIILFQMLMACISLLNKNRTRESKQRCWLHMRRRFANALLATETKLKNMTEEQIKAEPATKGLMLSNAIFEAETSLKTLSAEESFEARLEEVKPCVDASFEFVHSFDVKELKGHLKDAVKYALCYEGHLKLFLEDGNIPIDNGESERRVKPVAILRKNSMFSYCKDGAETNMIMLSLLETAKANGADAFRYEEKPKGKIKRKPRVA